MTMDKPPRLPPRIIGYPKIRQLYWCDFPKDAHLPEFWKRRPVIIVSYKNKNGVATVVPTSTNEQNQKWPWSVPIDNPISSKKSWAVCDKISTFAISRFIPDDKGVPQLSKDNFNTVLAKIFEWLPKPSY